jgi:2-amino-4-hydroxy-6-hydroxymethyldihydropteridine diphosphokinase
MPAELRVRPQGPRAGILPARLALTSPGRVLCPAVEQVYVGLGSNIGDRERTLERALLALGERGLEVSARSSLYLTEPMDAPSQEWFLNAVAGGRTALAPEDLLQACLEVEREMGRLRLVYRGPRTIDLDLLLYGSLVRHSPGLTVPHPRLAERRFVLVPLDEIAPEVVHPVLGLRVRELLERCPDASRVLPYQPAARPS